MEHVEEAGVHSGDAACTLPPSTLSDDQIRRLREEGTYAIAKGCHVQGLINVQYAFMANTLYVIEANPRASVPCHSPPRPPAWHWRAPPPASWPAKPSPISVPTVCCCPRATAATSTPASRSRSRNPCCRSSASAPRWARPSTSCSDLRCVPPVRSWASTVTSTRLRQEPARRLRRWPADHGNVFISVNDTDKRQLPLIAVRLEELGFKLWATGGHRLRASPLRHRVEHRGQDQHPRGYRSGSPGRGASRCRIRGQERGSALSRKARST